MQCYFRKDSTSTPSKVSFLKPRHCFLACVILWFAGGDFVLTEGILTAISNKPQTSVVQIIDIYFLPT